jgi:hypothetical protein
VVRVGCVLPSCSKGPKQWWGPCWQNSHFSEASIPNPVGLSPQLTFPTPPILYVTIPMLQLQNGVKWWWRKITFFLHWGSLNINLEFLFRRRKWNLKHKSFLLYKT